MKKISKSISKYYSNVVLFKEDIEEIVELLKENGSESIKIVTDKYELDPLELSTLKEKKFYQFDIRSYKPLYFHLELQKEGIHLYCDEDSTLAVGILNKIGSIVAKRSQKLLSLLTNFWLLASIMFAGILIAAFVLFISNNRILYYTIYFLFLIPYILGLLIRFTNILPKNFVTLEYKKDGPNFLERNKDTILITAISVILTAIATYLVTITLK